MDKKTEVIFKFKHDVSEIPNDMIEHTWIGLKLRLVEEGYDIKNIEMPKVKTLVLNKNDFIYNRRKIEKVFIKNKFRQWMIDHKQEYGDRKLNDEDREAYIIEGCEGQPTLIMFNTEAIKRFNDSIEECLRHELLHIFEWSLKLPAGTLTYLENN